MGSNGHWWCDNCKEVKDPIEVTYEENCADCGWNIRWVDHMRGILFSELQGDFYELTGLRPLKIFTDSNGLKCTTAVPEYVEYLEGRVKTNQQGEE